MAKLVESDIEELALQRLWELGYGYYPGADIAPDGPTPFRSSLESPLLETRLQDAIDRLNPEIPPVARLEALRKLSNIRGCFHLHNSCSGSFYEERQKKILIRSQ